jgi:hypothetical protein
LYSIMQWRERDDYFVFFNFRQSSVGYVFQRRGCNDLCAAKFMLLVLRVLASLLICVKTFFFVVFVAELVLGVVPSFNQHIRGESWHAVRYSAMQAISVSMARLS